MCICIILFYIISVKLEHNILQLHEHLKSFNFHLHNFYTKNNHLRSIQITTTNGGIRKFGGGLKR